MFTIAREDGFDFLSEEYARLFHQAGATPFQHPTWLDRLYGMLAPGLDAQPVIVTARDAGPGGRLRMVLPLMRRRHRGLRLIEFADLQVSDYAFPVCDEAAFHALADDPLAGQRIRDLLRPYDVVRIKKAPQGAPELERLLPASRRVLMPISAHAAPLAGSFTDWQSAAISPSYVKELARKRRRLGRHGVATFELLQEPDLVEEAFRWLRVWRGERYPDDLLQQDLYYAFYTDVASAGAASGLSRTFRLAVDGQTIAVAFTLCGRESCLVLLSGFDAETYKGCSVGALMFEDIARDCIARGDQVLDFSLGDEAYKARFGCRPMPLWMISASGTTLGAIANSVAPHLRRPPRPEPRNTEQVATADLG